MVDKNDPTLQSVEQVLLTFKAGNISLMDAKATIFNLEHPHGEPELLLREIYALLASGQGSNFRHTLPKIKRMLRDEAIAVTQGKLP